MVARRSRCVRLILITLAITGPMAHLEARQAGRPHEPSDELRTSEPAPNPSRRPAWPLVHIPDPEVRRVVTEALDAAAARLATPTCARILTDFAAVAPHLTDPIDSLDNDIQRYVARVVFIDDSRHRICLGPTLAFTTPGSRVVRVCRNELMRQSFDRNYMVAMVIHEILHTLGLPENPPSSRDITRRVLARCGKTS